MNRDDLKSWGASLALHALLFVFLAFTMAGNTPERRPPPPLVEVDFGPLPAPSQARPAPDTPTDRPAQRASPDRTATRPDRPTAPDNTRSSARPEAPTPVNLPRPDRRAETRRPEPAPPTPRRDPAATPRPPAPATPRPSDDPPSGSPTPPAEPAPREQETGGAPGGGTDPAATGTGSTGVSVSGLGSRGSRCPRPSFPGVSGRVTYAVTFSPEGRYVSARPVTRGGAPQLDQAARAVLPSCRADALPGEADQVNQTGQVTFNFVLRAN